VFIGYIDIIPLSYGSNTCGSFEGTARVLPSHEVGFFGKGLRDVLGKNGILNLQKNDPQFWKKAHIDTSSHQFFWGSKMLVFEGCSLSAKPILDFR